MANSSLINTIGTLENIFQITTVVLCATCIKPLLEYLMRPKPVDKTVPNQACSEPQMAIRNIGNKIGLVSCRV